MVTYTVERHPKYRLWIVRHGERVVSIWRQRRNAEKRCRQMNRKVRYAR